MKARLSAKELSSPEQEDLARQLAKFAGRGAVQNLLGELLKDTQATPAARQTILKAMAQSGVKQLPDVWVGGLSHSLASDDFDLVRQAIDTARLWRDPKQKGSKLTAPLLQVGSNAKAPASVRLSALAVVPGGLTKVDSGQLELLLGHLGPEQPVALRGAAAEALSRAKLDKEQLRLMAPRLKTVGPMEFDRVLEAFGASSDEVVGMELLDALKTASSKSSLRGEMLKPRLAKFGPAVQKQAEELYASLNVDARKQKSHLEMLLQTTASGDKNRGHVIFNSEKAACFSCHAIGYRGGNVGPDLTHIARTRTDRDLLEAVVFPSLSFVRGYEPVQLTTTQGKVYNGVLRKDAPDEVVLAVNATEMARIPREDIDDIRPSQVSVMPAGYDQLLTPAELADLLAFLKACK
jgi:putative heme-binding domain-containing protein